MRLLIQRVKSASVNIGGTRFSSIGKGLLVFVGVEDADSRCDVEWLGGKVARLRVFDDESGVMNRSVTDVGGEVMVVSQFTLHASTAKGNRPSYIRAAKEPVSRPLYEAFVEQMRTLNSGRVECGQFGADMQVELVNDGPVTIWIDSKCRE